MTADFQVTPEIRTEFFKFTESRKFSTAEDLQKMWEQDPDRALLDLAIRTDMANVKFGLEAGMKVRSTGDPQVQKALTLFDEAARIAAMPKKAPGIRAAKTSK